MIAATPAFAEVCDKVRPDWSPSTGQVTAAQELSYYFSSTVGIILLVLCVLALLIKNGWLTLSVALVLLVVAGLIAQNWFWPEDGVTHAAYAEGCTANQLIISFVLTVLAVISFAFGSTKHN